MLLCDTFALFSIVKFKQGISLQVDVHVFDVEVCWCKLLCFESQVGRGRAYDLLFTNDELKDAEEFLDIFDVYTKKIQSTVYPSLWLAVFMRLVTRILVLMFYTFALYYIQGSTGMGISVGIGIRDFEIGKVGIFWDSGLSKTFWLWLNLFSNNT